MKHSPGGRELLAALLLFVVVGFGFCFPVGAVLKADDYPAIAWASDWGHVLHDFVGPQYDLSFFHFWRPWITASLALDHSLFGVDAAGFLAMNVLAFVLSVLCLWFLLRLLVPRQPAFAWMVAGLWLLHPAPVVSLDWVVGRVDTHAVLAMLVTMLLHLAHRRGAARWPVVLGLIWSFGSKESAIGLPFVLLGLDLLDPHPSLARGPRLQGRTLPGICHLLALPLFFLWRYFVLGEALGGYGFLRQQSFEPLAILAGLRQSLGQALLPGLPNPVRDGGVALLLVFVLFWSLRRPRAWGQAVGHQSFAWHRGLAVVLISAGIWGPLAQLLPSMRDSGQQRYAYAACLWSLMAWAGLVLALSSLGRAERFASAGLATGADSADQRPVPVLRSAVLLLLAGLPLLLLLPERAREVTKLARHDRFCRAMVTAVDEVVQRSQLTSQEAVAGSMVVVAGDAEAANQPQRFLWGFGALHAPPFRKQRVEVVTLRPLSSAATVVPVALASRGLSSYVEVHGESLHVQPATPGMRLWAKPVGFDGVLRKKHVAALGQVDCELGFACDPALRQVAVLTSTGSALLPVQVQDGVLRLRNLLLQNLSWAQGPQSPLPLIYMLLNPMDLAPQSPVFVLWEEHEGESTRIRIGRLFASKEFTKRMIREL